MSKKKRKPAPQVGQPASVRSTLSVIIPITLAIASTNIVGSASQNNSVPLGLVGISSWLMGMLWFRYGTDGLALRGGRPWFSGGGFAVIGWIFVLLLRIFLVEAEELASSGAGREFFYYLIFEAFAVHLWLFGLVFRSVADYRGGIAALIVTGVLFGLTAFSTFNEVFIFAPSNTLFYTTMLYLISWGLFYAVIRLRSGSILGLVMIQPIQSLTTWFLFKTVSEPAPASLHTFYIATAVVFLILVWRLWPREQEDFRV